MDLTVVGPAYNEEENVEKAVNDIESVFVELGVSGEIVLVDDGSTDSTREVAETLAKTHPALRVVSHPRNFGRGRALRTGFARARGSIVVTIDADLSYSAEHIGSIYRLMASDPSVDVVLGSPYMSGGQAVGIPLSRLLMSRLGNIVLAKALGDNLKTVTSILRGYRKQVLDSLDLQSDGKEIHLEILSKVLAMGYDVKEIPATLTFRRRGRSKFKFRATTISHLIFSISERPMMIFGSLGLLLLVLGLGGGLHIIRLWRQARLNPDRPLMTLIVILIVTGMQVLAFGFIGTQIVSLRKEIFRIQKENMLLKKRLERSDRGT